MTSEHSAVHRRNFWYRLDPNTRVLLMCMGVIISLMIAQVLYTNGQNDKLRDSQAAEAKQQRLCLAKQIVTLTDALNARAELSQQLTDATTRVINSFAEAAANQVPNSTEEQQQAAAKPIIKALENYSKVQKRVKEARKSNPLPEYPTGICVVVPSNEESPPSVSKNDADKSSSTPTPPPPESSTRVQSTQKPLSGNRNGPSGGGGGSGGNDDDGGTPSGGGGSSGGPTPTTPSKKPPLIDIDIGIDVPNLVSVKVATDEKPKVELLPEDDC